MDSQSVNRLPFGTRTTPTSASHPTFQPPATTHETQIPHPASARFLIKMAGNSAGGCLPSSLPSRLNTGSPPPPSLTTPIVRSTSSTIASLMITSSHLRPSPLGGSPAHANRNSSTHAGGISPPASFTGRAITSPTAPPTRSVVPTSLPFKNTTSSAGDRTSALPETMGGLTPGKKLAIGEVRANNMGSVSRTSLLQFIGSLSAPGLSSASAGARGSFERLFWKLEFSEGGNSPKPPDDKA